MRKLLQGLILSLLLFSCKESADAPNLKSPSPFSYTDDSKKMAKADYYDKVLGALVGSAIGDAMGASTEMWHRRDIQLKYGYITGLTPAERAQSPEGTWANNLMAGATTDDTRWKYLMVNYFSQVKGEASPSAFSKFINTYYASLTKDLGDPDIQTSTDILDDKMEKIDWIKEWARVSLAYEKDSDTYVSSLNRFYGGEMSCAGQLYSPMFGLVASNSSEAYDLGYAHSLFDIGYAKDISGLVAAMTHLAMRTKDMDSILNVVPFTDNTGYQDSRLVGRIPYSIWTASMNQIRVLDTLKNSNDSLIKPILKTKVPKGYSGTDADWARQEMAYRFLEKDKKAIAFHAGEIWQIMITGMGYGKGDFLNTMQFIVNYGRDNDTAAAIAGMILGAKDGYAALPKDLKEETIRVNREHLGIDLEQLAQEMTNLQYP